MTRRKLTVIALALVLVLGSAGVALAAYHDTVGHWAEADINWATEQGYLKGDGNGYFRPEDTVTKAEYVTGVNRLINASTRATIGFSDVRSSDWYYDELAKGVYNGIIDDSRYNFEPNKAITRDEAARIIARAYKLTNYSEGATIFRDYNSITYKGEVGALVAKNVLHGWPDGNYYPSKTLTRAEYAKILRVSVRNLGLPSKPTPVSTKPVVTKPVSSTPSYWWYGYDYSYGYYSCEVELSNLLSAIRRGEEYLLLTETYTADSLDVLKKAVESGRSTYNTYKDYKGDYRYGYYGYRISPWNYSTFSAFESAMKKEYPNVFTTAQLREIYNNYRDGRYYDGYYYGYEINPRNYTTLSSFERAMKNAYGDRFTYGEIKAIYEGRYEYGYGYYYGNYKYPYYYDTCPYQGTIDAATKKINDAIDGLVKKTGVVKVTSITVSPKTGEIEVGDTIQLTATIKPANATNKKVTWKSSDESVATVDKNGLVTGIKEGDVTITVTTTDCDCKLSAEAKIKVIPKTEEFDVTYRFEQAEGTTEELPAEVTKLVPERTKAKKGTNVTPTTPLETEVEVEGGKWTFVKYTPEKADNISADVEFVGTWSYEAAEPEPTTYKITITVTGSNGETISDATVTVTKDGAEVSNLNEVENGTYSVEVKREGYVTQTKDVTVEDDDVNVKFELVATEGTEKFTVTFVVEDGMTAPDAQEVESGQKASEPTAPTKEGYTFRGWFAESSETAFDFDTPITADITLTAKFAENASGTGSFDPIEDPTETNDAGQPEPEISPGPTPGVENPVIPDDPTTGSM